MAGDLLEPAFKGRNLPLHLLVGGQEGGDLLERLVAADRRGVGQLADRPLEMAGHDLALGIVDLGVPEPLGEDGRDGPVERRPDRGVVLQSIVELEQELERSGRGDGAQAEPDLVPREADIENAQLVPHPEARGPGSRLDALALAGDAHRLPLAVQGDFQHHRPVLVASPDLLLEGARNAGQGGDGAAAEQEEKENNRVRFFVSWNHKGIVPPVGAYHNIGTKPSGRPGRGKVRFRPMVSVSPGPKAGYDDSAGPGAARAGGPGSPRTPG